tara:strand:- start:71 stop:961 length:891 start_codon:yes stop_codon:yes gene_type:complete
MNRQLLVFFLIACFLLCSGFQNTQIRIGVEAVNILVAVTNKKGKFVTNLSRNQFEIREEGVIQEITNFDHETNLPLFIALIIDTSSSVRLKLDFEKQAATNFIYSLMRPVDRALLAEFDTGVSLRHDVTSRPGAIANEIKRLKAGGGTALIDALYVVSREKMTSSSRRNTAVILSDGRDLNSKKTVEEALRMVHQSGVVVYSIGTTRFGANGYIRGEEMLRTLSESTGGRVFLPYSAGKLSQAFELIDEELRSRYSLTYTPINKDKDGKFRKIEVRVSNGGKVNLRYRKGYFAPSE